MQLAQIVAQLKQPPRVKDWERTIGMLPDDEFTEEMFAAGRKIREADRLKAARGRK